MAGRKSSSAELREVEEGSKKKKTRAMDERSMKGKLI